MKLLPQTIVEVVVESLREGYVDNLDDRLCSSVNMLSRSYADRSSAANSGQESRSSGKMGASCYEITTWFVLLSQATWLL
ncbi:hypothetical protein K443DRAFT_678691 [Laccaria amethystina LaAM-08-1]|uniref:Uncharacterized protein n=1 Tax=Laccaria amethystina LaAM-08-1 TaxID=1095629 RepID=A0A0C9XHT8_9AGAR|nr:hypothetical protein K443DRAFT_678691 [Laccaria amethystina LaAM-08-1]